MDPELITKEKKYHKLNTELELKTKELMKEVHTILEKLNYCRMNNRSEINSTKPNEKTSNGSKKNSERTLEYSSDDKTQIIYKSDTLNKVTNNNLSRKKNQLDGIILDNSKSNSDDNVVILLQSKVNILLNELHQVKSLHLEKVKEYANLQSNYRKLEKEINNIKQSHFKMKESKSDWEKNFEIASNKLKACKAENKTLKNEIELLKSTLDQVKANDSIQLKNLLGEIGRLNKNLIRTGESGDLARNLNKNEIIRNQGTPVNQKSEMLILLKKQMQLLSNLKKQKNVLETKKTLKTGETAFLKMFNMHN